MNFSTQAELLQPETQQTQMGETVPAPRFEATPLNGRSYTDTLNVQAGVIPVTTQPASTTIMAGVTDQLLRQRSAGNTNGFIVAATWRKISTWAQPSFPNLESIDEFRILTSNFDAKSGNVSGGQVIVSTKSGANVDAAREERSYAGASC